MEDRLLTDATLKLIGHDQRAPLMTMREIATQQDSKTARLVAAEIIQIVRDWFDLAEGRSTSSACFAEFVRIYPDFNSMSLVGYLSKKYGLEG